ncbi:MAG: bifunctional phosphoribosylaminoimidazolecarboxamide formyltransferase/IMP cyclohydrolase [Cyclobacteriaceae bacterium]|nr:bifunctional phosphoribosylaminoimidazolecarboxamide formyltransferase/IMP cyclohydrolase [Cyclobacteriaceae bacterium]
MNNKKIQSALISVYYKDGLEPIIEILKKQGVKIYSTGGTQHFIEEAGAEVVPVEEMTGYPSIFGGRVKTLHPKVFGGILHRRDDKSDQREATQYNIPPIDLVIVDLYPFEETVASGASEDEIIEKIDIGGISLIRGAAKNFNDVFIVSSREQYKEVVDILVSQEGETTPAQRKRFAVKAFDISSHYDSAIFNYFNHAGEELSFKQSVRTSVALRYGENPHQTGTYYGKLDDLFEKRNGKELSYNNLVDVEAAVSLVEEFPDEIAFVIVKHTNACGVATGQSVEAAYKKALQADPVSAFGGILATNHIVNLETARLINELFYEVLIAPGFEDEALELLLSKKKRIILQQKKPFKADTQFKSLLNGVLVQDNDNVTDSAEHLRVVTTKKPTAEEINALVFASKIAKHTKSNTIVLANDGQLLASGVGQTSRVDALNQAILKANAFNMELKGSVMASDAFFPFPDCVEIADGAGITSVVQPGGSIKDQDSIDYCDNHSLSMVFTGTRHFKH